MEIPKEEVKGTLVDFILGIQAEILIAQWTISNKEERKEIKVKVDLLREQMRLRIPSLIEMNPESEEVRELEVNFRPREN